eukprot:30083-Chlamydomonas_euryale.AAC.1
MQAAHAAHANSTRSTCKQHMQQCAILRTRHAEPACLCDTPVWHACVARLCGTPVWHAEPLSLKACLCAPHRISTVRVESTPPPSAQVHLHAQRVMSCYACRTTVHHPKRVCTELMTIADWPALPAGVQVQAGLAVHPGDPGGRVGRGAKCGAAGARQA